MCTSGKRRWPIIGSIVQGLHASSMVCEHLQGNISVSQRNEALDNAIVLQARDISQRNCHRLGDISQWLLH